jgi:putative ABC transport system ATP-binding protein
LIRVANVSKHYDGKRGVTALEQIDLTIEQGEMVAVVGPSGSGKSTLLNLIGGLDCPTSGNVYVEGKSLSGISDRELTQIRRDKIGFIFQFFNLLPTLTCLENVAIPLHLRGWPRVRIEERSKELLHLVQLSQRMEHHPDELSGGERQRVAIARALSVYPPILLADEPTGNLDSSTAQDVLALLRNLQQSLQATVIMVTHDRGVAESCQRIIRIQDGHMIEDRRQ